MFKNIHRLPKFQKILMNLHVIEQILNGRQISKSVDLKTVLVEFYET